MKTKNLKPLNLNKKTVSVIKLYRIKGGTNGGTRTLEGFAETNECDG
ncbi:hypothetical protein IMCC3317_39160 [Kordia antarctica]|uniref:Uncharacterized protein n=1 Tax=Kordia antarctica TaxID=1218801 RepID=A0A7L4ZP78_9FLAO|nr:hypothetical protein [Kordia antarctica]QHI38523.1 hypothetical protein IMCC3317_39160 [Kordia antarctica]